MILLDDRPPVHILSASATTLPCPTREAHVGAFHEAGHAIVGRRYGLAVMQASIIGRHDRNFGCVYYTPHSWRTAPWQVQILALLAGQAAQDHATARFPLPYARFDATDLPEAVAILRQHLGASDWYAPDVQQALEQWRQYVGHSVHADWKSITRVAEHLLARKVLTGSEVEALR